MGTSYTYEIEKGNIKNFKDFAKLCSRAFGATIHMRDESLNEVYRKREIDPYYQEEVNEIESELIYLKQYPLEAFEKRKKEIQEDIEYTQKQINEKIKYGEIVNEIVKQANEWSPPTKEHERFKKFVLEQLSYAQSDCDVNYYEISLKELENEFKTLTLEDFIKQKTNQLERDLERTLNDFRKQKEICDESNDWIEKLHESLK